MKIKIKQIIILLAITFATVTACKKNKVEPPVIITDPVTPPPPTQTTSRADLSRDSIFLYAKELYLWNSSLPTYEVFSPRKYIYQSTNIDNYDQELFEITKFSGFEYKTGDTYPKYSYIMDRADKNPTAAIQQTASVDLEGNGNDFGVKLGLFGSPANYTIFITAVYQNSPAEKAKFVRGDKITKINGVTYGTNYSVSQENAINNAFNASNVTLEGVKSTGDNFSTSLVRTVFKSSPIYKSRIIDAGTKKIGYLAYARFSNADNSIPELDAVFSNFATNGVTDLVIDLRYNGGGYVSTAEHLVNLIAPASTNGGVMFTEYYNSTMQTGNAKILSNQPLLDENNKVQYSNGRLVTYADVDYSTAKNTTNFAKVGALSNVQNVVFIVSGGTASASELVINSLKPHMNVKLVGLTTYGKPVGFFPITIENKYDVYFSLFETKNSLGQGGYYDGMVPDYQSSEVSANNMMYDFGNVNDNYLKKAIDVLAPGVVVTSQNKTMSAKQKSLVVQSANVINSNLNGQEFKGMVEDRMKRKN